MDGFQPKGITKLTQDSVFMMPHLGVLSSVHPQIALEIFEKDCLIQLGTCIAPSWEAENVTKVLTIKGSMPNGNLLEKDYDTGKLDVIPLEAGRDVELEITPSKKCDVGGGFGIPVKTRIEGGEVGIIVNTRGRPLIIPEDKIERKKKLLEWYLTTKAYPEIFLEKMQDEMS